jgi:hypothetical protein
MRPDMLAGPMFLKESPAKVDSGSVTAGADASVRAPWALAMAGRNRAESTAHETARAAKRGDDEGIQGSNEIAAALQ